MTGLMRKFWILPIALLGLGLMPATSRATLTISLVNGSPTNTLNVVEPSGTRGTVFNLEDNNAIVMQINTNGITGTAGGTGQAAVTAIDSNFFQTVDFTFVAPFTGTQAIEINPGFNLANGTTFTVTGFDQLGVTTSRTFEIDNNNRFTIESDAIQFITGVRITPAPAVHIERIVQVRIGALVRGDTPPVVPEPSTLAMALTALVPLGFAGLRRLRRRPDVTSA
ncbi:hypothetical protein BH23PLA1_BH23PLA1_21460 [soil metagenome]